MSNYWIMEMKTNYIDAQPHFSRSDWSALVAHCRPAQLGPKYSIGQSNLVRQIMFEVGVDWVVRFRLPSDHRLAGRNEALKPSLILRVEVAGMLYLS